MLKVGIIGCGAIAKMHIPAVQKCANATIVGLADVNPAALAALSEKYGVANTYQDPHELLEKEKPDVVHILTQPQNHHALTKAALLAGCHVFVEKPLAMNAEETEELVSLAREKGKQLCVGHSHLFDGVMQKARAIVERGDIGKICGIESYYGFDMDPKYFSAKGSTHWGHCLPGGLLMNRIDHPLSVVLPFMDPPKKIVALGVDVRDTIPLDIPGEMRLLLSDGKTLAQITVSLAASPRFHQLTLNGTKGTLLVDFVNKRLMHYAHIPGLPKAISRAIINLKDGGSIFRSVFSNFVKVAMKKFHAVEGMPILIQKFYEALETGGPCPVTLEQSLTTMRVMDEAWRQMGCQATKGPVSEDAFPVPARKSSTRVLVTGATGFVGQNLVKKLLEEGKHDVRVLIRNPIKANASLRNSPVEVLFGDLTDQKCVSAAMEGVDIVYHLAAAMGGAWEDYVEGTIRSTESIVKAAKAQKIKKLVYVSTIAVCGSNGKDTPITEESGYTKKDLTHYIRSKIEAEKIVLEAVKKDGLNATIVRPGNIYGPGREGKMSRIGYKVGYFYVIVGMNNIDLPIVTVDGVVQALMLAGESANGAGKAYNVVDDEKVSQTGYIRRLSKYGRGNYNYVFFPYSVIAGLGALVRGGGRFNPKLKKIGNVLGPTHLRSCVRQANFDTSRIKNDLGWKPEPEMEKQFERMCH